MPLGFIYVAHNPEDGSDVFKVGKTSRTIDRRMDELTSATAVIGKYRGVAWFLVSDIDVAEARCHQLLARRRVQENREFFKGSLADLVGIVEEAIVPFRITATFSTPEFDATSLASPVAGGDLVEEALALSREENAVSVIRERQTEEAAQTFADQTKVLLDEAAAALSDTEHFYWTIPDSPRQMKGLGAHFCGEAVLRKLRPPGVPLYLYHHRLARVSPHERNYRGIELLDADAEFANADIPYQAADDGRYGRLSVFILPSPYVSIHRPRVMVEAIPIIYDPLKRLYCEGKDLPPTASYVSPQDAVACLLQIAVSHAKTAIPETRRLADRSLWPAHDMPMIHEMMKFSPAFAKAGRID